MPSKEHTSALVSVPPINRLPTELLTEIFRYHVSDTFNTGKYEGDGHDFHAPVVISHVCKLWRSIIHQDGRAWKNVRITTTHVSQPVGLDHRLNHANAQPLDLVLRVRPLRTEGSPLDPIPWVVDLGVQLPPVYQHVLALFRPIVSTSTVRSLVVDADLEVCVAVCRMLASLLVFISRPLSKLTYLHTLLQVGAPNSPNMIAAWLVSGCVNTRALSLSGFPTCYAFNGVNRATLVGTLTNLHLHSFVAPDMTVVLNCIAPCTALETLRLGVNLHWLSVPKDLPATRMLHVLPHLHTLELDDGCVAGPLPNGVPIFGCTWILGRICAPALRVLRLCNTNPIRGAWIPAAAHDVREHVAFELRKHFAFEVESFMRDCGPALEGVAFVGGGALDAAMLRTWMTAVPKLVAVEFRGMQRELLEAACRTLCEALPGLTRLYIVDGSAPLADFVAAWAAHPAPVRGDQGAGPYATQIRLVFPTAEVSRGDLEQAASVGGGTLETYRERLHWETDSIPLLPYTQHHSTALVSRRVTDGPVGG